jgi:predicted PolB exonuclease-like 3'-5' exonuclease
MMGLNNENARRLVFDIETAPLAEAAGYLEPVEAPANYKDSAKIDAYIAEKAAQELDRCSLDVDLCRVVAIGWCLEGDAPNVTTLAEATEAQMIAAFWKIADARHLIGFNCLGFDLPVLLRRSLYLALVRPMIQIDKYRHPAVTDLSDELSFAGKLRLRSLSFYCKRFGIDVADTLRGADIAAAVRDGRWADVASHCAADIAKTARLAEKLGVFNMVAAEAVL